MKEKCQHEGCEHDGEECTITTEQGEEVVDGHYCGEHAAAHGFCPCCGQFWGGICSFEMNGICDYCKDEIEEEDAEWDSITDESLRYPDYDDDGDDIVGSCDNCGSNIYAEEADSTGLCGQCQWYAAQGMPEQRRSE